MPGWMRKRVLIWATGASATVAGLSLITPIMVDTLFDVIQIGLVYLASRRRPPVVNPARAGACPHLPVGTPRPKSSGRGLFRKAIHV